MTRYEARFNFGSDVVPDEQVDEWLKALEKELPDGVEVSLRTVPLILDVDEVTEEHAGNRVTIRGYYDKVTNGDKKKAKEQATRLVKSQNLTGTLEHVFITGAHSAQRTLVIDGKAYDIPAYSMIELGEW